MKGFLHSVLIFVIILRVKSRCCCYAILLGLILCSVQFNFYLLLFSELRVEGLETLDYLDNLQNREQFTEQGDAITFESGVSLKFLKQAYIFCLFNSILSTLFYVYRSC